MKLVGIDLGTTNSAISIVNEFGKPEIIPNKEGERITPSVVLFDHDQIIVGSIAKQSAVADPENTISNIKTHIGSSDFMFLHKNKEFTPEDIAAMILRKMIDDAEIYLGEKITDVVITVPAYFNDNQRKATIDAGKIAGVNILQIINEPTAAALTYGLDKNEEQTIIVYDLGGGTFDVTIMKLESKNFDVIASDGDKQLGGNDFDDKVMIYLNDRFKKQFNINLLEDPILAQDLRLKSENAKKALSSKSATTVYLSAEGKSGKYEISRELYKELVADLVSRTELLLEAVLEDAEMEWDDIDQILLVGGSTRMPVVVDMIRSVSGKEPLININPDEAISLGASIQAGIITARDEKSEIGDMVRMKYGDVNVSDVTSHSFGAITLDEYDNKRNAIIIPKNSKIPIRKSQIFYTTIPNQSSVKLNVLQGEDPDPEFCTMIGTTTLSFAAKKINSPIIFNYEYDVNSRIHCTAKDPETGKKNSIVITREGDLSGDEVRAKTDQLDSMLPKRREYTKKQPASETDIDFVPDQDSSYSGAKMVADIFHDQGGNDIFSNIDKAKNDDKEEVIKDEIPGLSSEFPLNSESTDILFESTLPKNTNNDEIKEVIKDEIKKESISAKISFKSEDQKNSESEMITPSNSEDSSVLEFESTIDFVSDDFATNKKELNKIEDKNSNNNSSVLNISHDSNLTDETLDNLVSDREVVEMPSKESMNSQLLDNTIEGLESTNTNEWDKILKIMKMDENEEGIASKKKTQISNISKPNKDGNDFIQLAGKMDSTVEGDKEEKLNTFKKTEEKIDDSELLISEDDETIMDWINDDDDDELK